MGTGPGNAGNVLVFFSGGYPEKREPFDQRGQLIREANVNGEWITEKDLLDTRVWWDKK